VETKKIVSCKSRFCCIPAEDSIYFYVGVLTNEFTRAKDITSMIKNIFPNDLATLILTLAYEYLIESKDFVYDFTNWLRTNKHNGKLTKIQKKIIDEGFR
jgi:hypothetical protein